VSVAVKAMRTATTARESGVERGYIGFSACLTARRRFRPTV
jgi:hypothetical protein